MIDEVIFREVQQFRHPLLWIFMLLTTLLVVGYTVRHVLVARRLPTTSVVNAVTISMLVSSLMVLAVCLLLWTAKLTTEVHADGLYIKLFPLHLSFHNVPLANASSVESVTYRPLRDYGGWGIRQSGKGRAYNVSGDRGVLITYGPDRPSILIGSQQAEQLETQIKLLLPTQ